VGNRTGRLLSEDYIWNISWREKTYHGQLKSRISEKGKKGQSWNSGRKSVELSAAFLFSPAPLQENQKQVPCPMSEHEWKKGKSWTRTNRRLEFSCL
jgi:hypothetical protein